MNLGLMYHSHILIFGSTFEHMTHSSAQNPLNLRPKCHLKSLSRSRLLCAVVGNSGGQYIAHLALSLHQPRGKIGSRFRVIYQPAIVRSNQYTLDNGLYSMLKEPASEDLF